ncbi:MAG: YfhO family protein [Oscillospiraceae bacterium]|nr:YfhO family protein [Oscillospiraceae bacterium]
MELVKKKRSILPAALSFLLPALVSAVVFMLSNIAPFGTYSILRSDAWGQYHPFLSLYRQILLNGGSLEHTWAVGMGINFMPIFSYYLSSPLNLLVVFFSESALPVFMFLLTVLKLGLAGLSFYFFLTYAYKGKRSVVPFFALLYALCAWAAGYYWNIIWLDVFALFPTLIAGTLAMLRESKFRLYVLSLALTFLCNYYLSFCCCIFVLLAFIGYHAVKWSGWKNFSRTFLRFGVCTLLAFVMAAALLLPTLLGMQNTASASSREFPIFSLNYPTSFCDLTISNFFKAVSMISAQTLTNIPATYMDGLPNLFCGFSAMILALSFLCNKTFSKKDRLLHGLLLIFFVLSSTFTILDYLWHGLHFPNMIPGRYTFQFSFLVLAMAYRGYTALDRLSIRRFLIALAGGVAIIAMGFLNRKDISFGYYTQILCVLVLVATGVVYFLHKGKLPLLKPTLARKLSVVLLCLLLLGESFLSMYNGVDVGVQEKSVLTHGSLGSELYNSVASKDDELFYRVEFSHGGVSNDGAQLHYNGVEIFSSSALVSHGNIASALGLLAWPESNSITFAESSPFSHTLCGIKYIIGRGKNFPNPDALPLVASREDYELRSVPSYVGLGFMTRPELSTFVSYQDQKDPFAEQNELFCLATGLEGQLYTPISQPELEASEDCTIETTDNPAQFLYKVPEDKNKGDFTLRYTIEEGGHLCIATRMPGGHDMDAYRNGELLFNTGVASRGIMTLGQVLPGDVIELVYTSDDYKEAGINIYANLLNEALLEEGLKTFSDEVWNITYTDDTTLTGNITVLEDGLFYSSVPYEPGWTVTVDGKEIPVCETYDPQNWDVKLTDALISFPLTAGTHEITMEYKTPGLRPGLISSLSAWLIFALLVVLKKTLFPNAPIQTPTDKGESL